jgi:hypothetical protein
MTRTIELSIPDELLQRVDERAQAAGLQRDVYIRSVLSRDVNSGPSIGEILSEFRYQVTASAIGDHELDGLFEQARNEAHHHSTDGR